MGIWSPSNILSIGSPSTTWTLTVTTEPAAGATGTFNVKVNKAGSTSGFNRVQMVAKGPAGQTQNLSNWNGGLADGNIRSQVLTIPFHEIRFYTYIYDASTHPSWLESDYSGTSYWAGAPPTSPASPVQDAATLVLGGPVTLGPGVSTAPVGAGVVTAPTGDLLSDLSDRAAARLVDRDGVWTLEPALPTAGTPTLTVAVGTNLVTASSVLDVDTADHAQQVRVLYTRPWREGDSASPPGTVLGDGSSQPDTVEVAVMSTTSHGPATMDVRRTGVPATTALAQQVATALAARAWLRGRSVEVTCPAAWWVRPGDTIRLTLPGGTWRDLWAAQVRHTAQDATTSLVLREFALSAYPPD
jgi:hypothetical protein